MWIIEKYIKYLVGFGLLWVLLFCQSTYGCQKVTTVQMAPLYDADGFAFYNKRQHDMADLKAGDVIVYRRSIPNFPQHEYQVGRIIATEGHRISIGGGYISVDGAKIGEEYVKEDHRGSDNIPEITIPRGCLYVLNDFRTCEMPDCRQLGPLSVHSVLGKTSK